MNIIKLLAIIILVNVIYRLFTARKPGKKTLPKNHQENLVSCNQCEAHIPLSTAVRDNTGNYLCKEHRQHTQ